MTDQEARDKGCQWPFVVPGRPRCPGEPFRFTVTSSHQIGILPREWECVMCLGCALTRLSSYPGDGVRASDPSQQGTWEGAVTAAFVMSR